MRLLLVDAGGTKTKTAVWEDGVVGLQVVSSGVDLGESLKQVAVRFEAEDADTLALAVGGMVNSKDGTTQQMEKHVDVFKHIDEAGLPRPVVFVNDTAACAAGETEGEEIALVQWSTGVGVAIADEELVRADGADGYPLALGHLALADRKHLCYCGGRGCVSTAAAWTTLRETVRAVGRPADEPIDVLAALDDTTVRAALKDAVHAIARLSAFIAATTQRQLRLGGGLALCYRDQLDHALEEEWLKLLSPTLHRHLDWSFSTRTDSAGLWGLARFVNELEPNSR